MKIIAFSDVGRKGMRCLLILSLVICTQGSNCGSHHQHDPRDHSDAQLDGNNPNGTPPANATTTLLTLINNQRTGAGLAALVEDPIGDRVANDYASGWADSGYSSDFCFDVAGDLHSQGVSVSQETDCRVEGYSDPQLVFNALQAHYSPFVNASYTRIGISLTQPANGNYWVIIQY